MNAKLLNMLRNQTIVICDLNYNSLGSGFFVDDRTVLTAEHCIPEESSDGIINMKQVFVRLNTGEFIKGNVIGSFKGIACICIFANSHLDQMDRFPIGYCEELCYGTRITTYGYPEKQPDGYSLSVPIFENIHRDGKGIRPSIKCLTRNVEGALDRYDGLSGGPIVVQNYIVGMVAKEDESGNEVNAIHIIDFSDVYDVIKGVGINIEKVYLRETGQEKNKCKLGRESLYGRAWWLMKKNMDQESITISDRYSIVLATLLLGIEGKADIILATPWEYGIGECLQEETLRYKKEFSGWGGRCWIEYENGTYPNWEIDENVSGIIISIHAEDCTDVLLSGLLIGRRGVQKDILVLWNIWSENSGQAVFQAIRVADQFHPDERKDLLTVFSSWAMERDEEKFGHTFLVHETADAWLKNQPWRTIDWDLFLLGLNAEETDVLAWVFFQYCQNDECRTEFIRLWEMCSDSVRILSSLLGNEDDLSGLRMVEPFVIKMWFSILKKEDCDRILSFLREEENQSLYWNAIISNPYCTGDVLKECCSAERRMLVHLILDQNTRICDDIMLCEEAENIRRQIRPV